jgi:hypothetical protein
MNNGDLPSSSFPPLLRTVLPPLLAPALFLDALVTLRFSRVELRAGFDRVLGATMTSASGAILANGLDDGGGGSREVISMFAVDVGDK